MAAQEQIGQLAEEVRAEIIEGAKDGLEAIVATAKHIADIGGIDAVAFGSDFDGFTDPPDDLEDISQMPRLTDALLRAGFSEEDVGRILGGNAARVLRSLLPRG